MGTVLEGRVHLWVQLDHEVALLRDLLVALHDLLLHPVAEGVAQDGVRDVGDPLLGQPHDLLLVRVVVEGGRVLADELVQALDLERLVLRDLQVAALVVLEVWMME